MTVTTNNTFIPQGESKFEQLFKKAVEERTRLQSVFELHSNAIPNLTNPIHPLFRRSNFPSASLYEYDGMELALRLASLWLTTEPLLDWWVHAAYDFEVPHPRRADKLVLEQGMKYDKSHTAVVQAALANLAEFVDFDFDIFSGFVSCARSQWNESRRAPVADAHPFFQATNRQAKRVLVKLHSHFKTYAREAFFQDALDGRLRYSFYLAAVITHEMCHAFSMMKRNSTDEPYFSPGAPRTDWGHAWEMETLGGEINPWHPSQMAPTVTLMAADWVEKRNQKVNGGLASSVVPMDWIARWFRRKFWSELRKGNDLRCPPACELQVWQRADRRGYLIRDEIDLYVRRESETSIASPELSCIQRSRGTKRKVGWRGDVDSGYASAKENEAEEDSRRNRFRTANGGPVKPKKVRIDDS